jgi:uncharacterized membrane protein
MPTKIRIDLLLINLLNLILILAVVLFPTNAVRVILGFPFILFFSGYVTLSALYPTKTGMIPTHRLMLSFALSIAIVPLLLLLLNFTSWGIRQNPVLFTIAGYTFVLSVIAWVRWQFKPAVERFTIDIHFRKPQWNGFGKASRGNKIVSVILGICVLGAIGLLVYVVRLPRASDTYTEFYVLGEDDKALYYPTALVLGDEGKVIIGLINHEKGTADYRVEIQVNGLRNSEIDAISLANGEKWEQPVSFTPSVVGTNQRVEFLLYQNGETLAGKTLHIWFDVTE